MIIKYKIVELYEDNRTMVVRYYTELLSEQELVSVPNPNDETKPFRCKTDVSISIPIPEPSEKELVKLILSNAPIKALETFEKLKLEPEIKALPTVVGLLNIEQSKTKEEMIELLQPVITEEKIKEIVDQIK
jgi:dTDP-4-amino-4,6-dideoxygalactose transaminase